MPSILVALDGSRQSEKALETAVKLAQHNGGRLTAVSVLDCARIPPGKELPECCRVQARQRLSELLQTAENFARSRGVFLSAVLCEGHPADAILTCAEQHETELLVLGSSSRVEHQGQLGDTADHVSSHCPCDVLIVR